MILGGRLNITRLLRLANSQKLSLGTLLILFILVRFIALTRGLRYDGDRLVQTFMQFPDLELLNFENLDSVFFDFHFTAPGFPILYIFSEFLLKSLWWIAP